MGGLSITLPVSTERMKTDKELAFAALGTLQRLRHVNRITAVRDLLRLQEEVGKARVGERLEAWLAICHLWSALKENTGADASGHWDNAIAKVEAWTGSVEP